MFNIKELKKIKSYYSVRDNTQLFKIQIRGYFIYNMEALKKYTEIEFHGVSGRKINIQDLKITVPPGVSSTTNPSNYWKDIPKPPKPSLKVLNCKYNYNAEQIFQKESEIPFGVTASLLFAYKYHADVLLRPDDIWIMICHGLSVHISQNVEKLRHLFVDHKGKKELVISTMTPFANIDWEEISTTFGGMLDHEVKGDFTKILPCDFSTSTRIDYLSSMISLMTTMKHYFTYKMIIGSGIRNVIMLGKEEDWIKLREKALSLQKYELENWIPKIVSVIDNFIETYRGNPDLKFWNYMVDKVDGRGGSGMRTIKSDYSGWIVNFYPYNAKGFPVTKMKSQEFPKIILKCPVKVVDTTTNQEHNLKFLTGFSGQGYEKECFFPQLSYAFAEKLKLPGGGEEKKKPTPSLKKK